VIGRPRGPGIVAGGVAVDSSRASDTCREPGPLAWIDGRLVPAAAAVIPVGDAGFVLGTTVTEQLRTFRGVPFLPGPHAARFGRSLATAGIVPPFALGEIFAAVDAVGGACHAALAGDGDLGIVVLATPGDLPAQHGGRAGTPRVIVHAFALAFASWADAYAGGVSLRTVRTVQVPAACWPADLKCRSRMHYHLADREARAAEPGARALVCHADGRVSETSTANVAIVRGGAILTPPPGDALPGVSLGHLRTLAGAEGIAWREASIGVADVAGADEVLLTSTPSCVLPATSLDGRGIGTGRPGPVFRRLIDAWSRGVGLDIVAQALAHRSPDG
jgi:branched-subunit amino acid aminotransferase/4-amino-4-deoxychorismate lyase